MDKETFRAFDQIIAEIHNTLDTNDPERLKRIKRRLKELQDLAEAYETTFNESAPVQRS